MMSVKHISLLASIAAILFASSCSFVDDSPVPAVPAGDVTITASFELPQDATKTSLSEENKVLWSAGDAFALLTDKTKDRFGITSGAGTASASFSGSVSGSAPYYAFYPYSESCRIEDGAVKFSLPQEQAYVDGSFASGASPAIAMLASATAPANFRNLCGVLQLNLCGATSVKVQRLEVINLDGRPLWGDCSVALDGKQGTNDQTMTVTGGSSTITITFSKQVSMHPSIPKVVDIVVPANSFAKGFTVKAFDGAGAAVSFFTAANGNVKAERSFITSMETYKIPANGEPADTCRRGHYKDVFMDGGLDLTSRTTLPACDYRGWSLDFLATSDTLLQERTLVQSDKDANGVLLYPDGSPRYRLVYVNGGWSIGHGNSLGTTGRSRFINFVNHGGCYSGSCAGAFIAHSGYDRGVCQSYFGLIPVTTMLNTDLHTSYTGINIPKDSPLLNYGYDFGGDFYIDSVYHNGGGYMMQSDLPAKGEILATYVKPGWKMDGHGGIWSYKANDTKGRVVVIGSHPEGVLDGEQRDLVAAVFQYAMDGAGTVSPKTRLQNGTVRKQTSASGTLARIGDKQYHHFDVDIPEGAKNVKICLESESGLDLHLAMRKGALAWRSDADYLMAQGGGNKTLEFDALEAGMWYVSVYCPANVKTVCSLNGFSQSGDTDALNGVRYTILVTWE